MTIKELASQAGVSTAAVSRYFNGGSLSEAKREQIRKVVEENSYTPNTLAKTMRTGRSGHVGVIVPRIHSDSMSQIMSGIADGLKENDYKCILGCTDNEKEKEIQFIKSMQRSGMDGIILMGTVMTPYLKDTIASCEIPIVVTGQSFSGVSSVYHDDVHSMKDIALIMLKKKRNVAYIGVDEEDAAVGQARRRGVEKAFSEMGLDLGKLIRMVSDYTIESGYEQAEKLLREHPETDGIICATDTIAHGVMKAVKAAGKRIPEDISVTGVGNSWADTITEPQLTTVKLYFEECGRVAVNILMQMINSKDKDIPVSNMKLGYQIIERGSV